MTAPITISSATARQVTGMSWRWCLRYAVAHAVPIYSVGRRRIIDAAAPLVAIRAHAAEQDAAQSTPTPEPGSDAELDAMRQRLGLRPRVA